MTIPSIVGTSSTSTGSASTTINFNLAAIVSGSPPSAGDLIIIEIMTVGTGATSNEFIKCTSSEGRWHTLGIAESPGVNGIFWKIREAGDGNTVTLTWGISSVAIVGGHVIRGADTVRPIARQSKARVTNSSYAWDAETTPVADCLALATATIPGANRSLTSAASGWTKQIDNSASISGATYFSQSQGFANSGTSTGTATTTIFGSGAASYLARMILIQPPQTATPKDVRVKVGSTTSPAATGNQDITVGFDVKALIITIADRNSDSVTTSLEWMVGIGADDGVTSSDQRCVGVWHTSGGSSQAGYNSSAQIVQFYQSGNSTLASPNLKATYSKITNGFRLNWTAVIAAGVTFNWVAFGGADVSAKMQAVAANASPVTGVAFRPELICALTAGINSATEQLRATGDMSWGFIDAQTGGEFNVSMMVNGSSNPVFAYRPNSFASEVAAGSLTWEVSHEQTTSSGFSWVGSNTDELFLLMLGFGGATYFPFEVESYPADSSGSANATQTLPAFARDLTTTTKQVVVTTGGPLTTSTSTAAAGAFIGIVEFDGNSTLDQDSFAIAKTTSTSKRNRKTADSFYIQKTGDLTSPAKIGSFTSRDVITWSTNDTGVNLIGLATIGWIGSTLTPSLSTDNLTIVETFTASTQYRKTTSDTVSVTDQVSTGLVKERSVSDTVTVSDTITARRELGRSTSDTSAVTESFTVVNVFGRAVTDACSVTDAIAARLALLRVTTDSVSVTDQLSPEVFRKVADAASVSDSLAAATNYVRASSDTSTVTDAVTARRELFRQIADSVSVADQLSESEDARRLTTDAVAVTDALSIERTLARSASDSISVSDQFASTAAFERAVSDAENVDDALAPTVELSTSDACSVTDAFSKEHVASRTVADAVSSIDQLLAEQRATREASDSVAVSEQLSATLFLSRVASDTCSVADVIFDTLAYGRVVSDTIDDTDEDLDIDLLSSQVFMKSVSESIVVSDQLTAATRYSRSIADAIAIADQVARTAQTDRAISDTDSVVEQLYASGQYVRAIADSASVADAFSRELRIERSASDSVSMSDASSDATTRTTTISDTLSVSDSVSIEQAFGRDLNDVVASSDALATTHAIGRKIIDAIAIADSFNRATNFVRSRTDVLASTSDSIARKATFGRSRIDAISVTDRIAVTVERLSEDAVSVSDSLSRVVSSKRTFNDTAIVADVIRRAVPYVRSASDSCSVTDHISPQVVVKKTDAVSVTDTLQRVVQFERYVPDAEETFDVVYVSRARHRTVSDSVAVQDRVTAEPQRKIQDSAATTDSLSTTTPYVRKVIDSAVASDRLVRAASQVRSASDALSVIDALAATRIAGRRVVDILSCVDQIRIEVFRRVSDTALVQDQVRVALAYAREQADATTTVDAARPATQYARSEADAVSAADALTAGRVVHVQKSDAISVSDSAARATDSVRQTSDVAVVVDSLQVYEVSFEVEVFDAVVVADRIARTQVEVIADAVTVGDSLSAVRTLGAKSVDVLSVSDVLVAEKLSIPKETLAVTDTLRVQAFYSRSATDAPSVVDRLIEDSPSLFMSGADAAAPGVLAMYSVADSPLLMSGGSGSDTGPVGFVTRLGDFVDCSDLLQMQLAIEISISDLAEVTD